MTNTCTAVCEKFHQLWTTFSVEAPKLLEECYEYLLWQKEDIRLAQRHKEKEEKIQRTEFQRQVDYAKNTLRSRAKLAKERDDLIKKRDEKISAIRQNAPKGQGVAKTNIPMNTQRDSGDVNTNDSSDSSESGSLRINEEVESKHPRNQYAWEAEDLSWDDED